MTASELLKKLAALGITPAHIKQLAELYDSLSAITADDRAALRLIEPTTAGQRANVLGADDATPRAGAASYAYDSASTLADDGERVLVTAGGKRWIATNTHTLVEDGGPDQSLYYAMSAKPVNPYCYVAPDLQCSYIAWGGREDKPQRIGTFAGSWAFYSTIGGGYDNTIDVIAGTLAGGAHHYLFAWDNGDPDSEIKWTDSSHNTVGGGSWNYIHAGTYCTVAGGTTNVIHYAQLRSVNSSTLEVTYKTDTHTGNGTTGPFAFTDTIAAAAELVVIKQETATGLRTRLALTTDYTVSVGGKTVTLTAALSSAYTLDIINNPVMPHNSSIGGGSFNTIANANGTIAGGYKNRVGGAVGTVGGGKYNVAWGVFDTIAGGGDNLIESGGNDTGTKNTISGGRYNKISGSTTCAGNTISGGESNEAYGNNNTIGAGKSNVIGNSGSSATTNNVIGGGLSNTITSGVAATLAGGRSNSASADYSTVPGGRENQATATYATALGYQAVARHQGGETLADGGFAVAGDAQNTRLNYKVQTKDATATALTRSGGSSTIVLPNDSTYAFSALVTARRTDANDDSAGFSLEGVIDRNASAGTVALVGTPTLTVLGRDSIAWTVTAEAATGSGGLTIKVQGESGKTIRWNALILISEVTG